MDQIYDEFEEYIYSSGDEALSDYDDGCNLPWPDEDEPDDDHSYSEQENYSTSPSDNIMSIPQQRVRMMIWSDLEPTMKRQLAEVVEVLGIPTSAASILLRDFRWSKEQLLEEFTNNSERVMRLCGVYSRCNNRSTESLSAARKKYAKYSFSSKPEKMRFCEICFEDGGFSPEDMMAMPCGHEFCHDCWRGFLNNMLREGTACLGYTCPQVGCNEKVTEEEVRKAAPELLSTFKMYQLKSFVETNMYSRWCPGRDCERVAVGNPFLSDSEKVSCGNCNTMFCFKCGKEPHSPMSCRDLVRWEDKNKDESKTADWIMFNTKTCPKCKTRIEKNGGCNHMTCRKCKHEFCWICLKNWRTHKNCNSFVSASDAADDNTFITKRELERYLHYYQRYQAHDVSQKLSEKARREFIDKKLEEPTCSNKFLKPAHDQLVECRCVLKYTFAFAYLNMSPKSDEVEKRTFEYHQGMLERFTENLSELVEKSTEEIGEIDEKEVTNLTRVVEDFVGKVLAHVEDTLGEN